MVLAEGACRYKSVYITDHHDKQYNLYFTANTGPDINSKLTRIYEYLYSDTSTQYKIIQIIRNVVVKVYISTLQPMPRRIYFMHPHFLHTF
jgi:hypothetical protein